MFLFQSAVFGSKSFFPTLKPAHDVSQTFPMYKVKLNLTVYEYQNFIYYTTATGWAEHH